MVTRILTLALAFMTVFGLATTSANAQCTSCTYTYNGSGNNYNLSAGQTLCIQSGTFSGNVNFNGNDITICIAPGATYSPNNFSFRTGMKILNNGTLNISGANVDGAASIENNGVVNVNGNLNYNNVLNVTNGVKAVWNNNTNFELKRTSVFTNEGIVNANAEFNSESTAQFINNGRLIVKQNFNPNGIFVNNGFVQAQGFININSNSNVVNNCTFFSNSGFNNNSNKTQNYGLIWVTGENTTVQINNNFYQGEKGLLRGANFTNNAAITGSGNYYFTAYTRNQGPFGQDGKGINFYDVTRSNPNTIFDAQNQNPHSTVTANAFAPEDTSYINSGCSDNFPIPIATDSVIFGRLNTVVTIKIANIAYDTAVGLDFGMTNLLPNGNVSRPVNGKTGDVVTFIDEGKGTYYYYPDEDILEFHPEQDYMGTSSVEYYVKNRLGFRSNVATVTIIIENSTLPVELLSFSATPVKGQVQLDWSTASETQNDYFAVERSADGIYFETIERVEGNGNSVIRIDYQTTDVQPLAGVNYYRLKQVDYDGAFEYSKIVTAVVSANDAQGVSAKLYPNPASDQVTISSNKGVKTLTLFDSKGAVVRSEILNDLATQTNLNIAGLQAGLYIVSIQTNDNQFATEKLIVK